MVSIGNFFFHYRNALFPLVHLLVLVPSPSLLPNDRVALIAGILLSLLGQGLRALTIGLVYIRRGGKNRRVYAIDLVQDGMFAHCRNPLYDGNILIVLGIGIAVNSLLFLTFGGAFFIFAYFCIVMAEEEFLRNKFGPAYDDYCRRVPRFRIRVQGLGATLSSMNFRWRRLIVKEYGTPFAWITGLLAILYFKQHLFVEQSFSWDGGDTIFATIFAFLLLLYSLARFLKKTKVLRAD
jgi:protein-S-isoprenylcysteine O-methyltransferase Ste14